MSLIQLQAPDLSTVSLGGATLYLLEGLGFSADGKQLLVRATFMDDADPGPLHSAVWVYDIPSGLYIRCLNQELAQDGVLPSTVDVSSAVMVGSGNNTDIVTLSQVRGVDLESKLSLIDATGVVADLISAVLGTELQPRIEHYAFSEDGRFLAVQTANNQLASVLHPDSNDVDDIYLIDLSTNKVNRVSAFADGSEINQPVTLGNVIIDQNQVKVSLITDGQFVATDKNSTEESPGDAYLWSSQYNDSGLVGNSTFTLVSSKADGNASGMIDKSEPIQTTINGTFFTSPLNGLVSADTNNSDDVYFKQTGGTLSVLKPDGLNTLANGATFLSSSSNGSLVAFLSASPEISGQTSTSQIAVANRDAGDWKVLSSQQGTLGNNETISGVMSPTGNYVAFTSLADNLSQTLPPAFSGSLYIAATGWFTNGLPIGDVSITGSAQQGQTLTASNTLSDVDGLGAISYRWLANGAEIAGAIGSTYTLTQADVGKTFSVRASYIDALGTAESKASATTVNVANVNDAPQGGVSITGTAKQGQTLTASNTLSDIDGLGTISYRWLANGIEIPGATGSTYSLTQAEVGKTISVRASYTDGFGTAESRSSPTTEAVIQSDSSSGSSTNSGSGANSGAGSNPDASSNTGSLATEPAPVAFEIPVAKIDSIGLTPDGKFLIIKTNGISKIVPIDSELAFSDSTKTAEELTSLIQPIAVFTSVVNGESQYVLPDLFTGPASLNLKYQLIDTTPNAVVRGSSENDFIKVANDSSIGKAVDAGDGDDVVDGGVGSTFVTGGGGSNTFFLDGRAPGVSWSTITDFKLGIDKATIWGWKAGVSRVSTAFTDTDTGGAPGYTGLTLHFENLLPDDAAPGQTNSYLNSITLSGRTLRDFGAGSLDELNEQIASGSSSHFLVGSVSDQYGDHGYLFLS